MYIHTTALVMFVFKESKKHLAVTGFYCEWTSVTSCTKTMTQPYVDID